MKKQLFIFSILIVIISIFVSCSTNSSSEVISTTAVTNSNGTMYYYEPVTDDNGNVSTIDGNQSIFVEIETQSNGKAVTKKDGTYVTNEHTIILSIKNTNTTKFATTTLSSTEINTTDNSKVINTTTKKETDNIRTTKSTPDNLSSMVKDTTDADNHKPFETSTQKEHQSKTTTILNTTMSNNNSNKKDDQTSNTELETKITTNKDGWIDKWY